ncbi:MAG: geranylgeranyl reductase family protein, partial [Pseudomonadota bacterium]
TSTVGVWRVSGKDQSFDVLVIGCGPSGGAAAFASAAHGLTTAIIDKASFPRNKLCGGLFTGRSAAYFRQVFGENLPAEHRLEQRHVAFWHDGAPLARMSDVPPLYLTMRWDLDQAIYRRVVARGVADFTGCAIAALDLERRCVTLKDGRRLSYKVLIAADGVNSIVAKKLWGAAFDRRTIGFGLEIEAATSSTAPFDPVRIDFAAARWGYGWSFPKPNSTTIGVGGLLAENADFKSVMTRYLRGLEIDPDTTAFKGHFIPFGDYRKRPGEGAVVLCGDAAGLVDPITGEGIAYAIKSGALAADAAHDALRNGTPEETLAFYIKHLRPIHRSLWMARVLRNLIFAKPFESTFRRMFQHSTTLKHDYMRLLAGEKEYADIVRKLARRVPKVAAKTLQDRVRRAAKDDAAR